MTSIDIRHFESSVRCLEILVGAVVSIWGVVLKNQDKGKWSVEQQVGNVQIIEKCFRKTYESHFDNMTEGYA